MPPCLRKTKLLEHQWLVCSTRLQRRPNKTCTSAEVIFIWRDWRFNTYLKRWFHWIFPCINSSSLLKSAEVMVTCFLPTPVSDHLQGYEPPKKWKTNSAAQLLSCLFIFTSIMLYIYIHIKFLIIVGSIVTHNHRPTSLVIYKHIFPHDCWS